MPSAVPYLTVPRRDRRQWPEYDPAPESRAVRTRRVTPTAILPTVARADVLALAVVGCCAEPTHAIRHGDTYVGACAACAGRMPFARRAVIA